MSSRIFIKVGPPQYADLGQALDQDELMLAFRGAPQQLIDYFLENVSERQALVMKDDMEVATPNPLSKSKLQRRAFFRQAASCRKPVKSLCLPVTARTMFRITHDR
ncbi:MAG: hypothetical protein CM15mP120_08390 [Pseudomonadota bacterium]|nr:MAG: hypothetical protein CM15mP120_08390 [Pseudomonadota bacterium]